MELSANDENPETNARSRLPDPLREWFFDALCLAASLANHRLTGIWATESITFETTAERSSPQQPPTPSPIPGRSSIHVAGHESSSVECTPGKSLWRSPHNHRTDEHRLVV
jgi:hypothetical protein